MSKLSSVGDAYALDYVTGRAAPFSARTTYLCLLTSPPNDATTISTMTEVTTGGYARQSMAGNWSASSGQPATTSNIASVVFGPFTATTVLISWACLVSVSSGTTGDYLMYWTLNNPQAFSIGQSLTIPAASLVMSLG